MTLESREMLWGRIALVRREAVVRPDLVERAHPGIPVGLGEDRRRAYRGYERVALHDGDGRAYEGETFQRIATQLPDVLVVRPGQIA